MGCSPLARNCTTNYSTPAPAPNPDPSRWELLDVKQYAHGHVLTVRYLDATNFEGVKVMVFRGQYKKRAQLDPHFSRRATSPIARFRPDGEGKDMAIQLARSLKASR